MKRIYSICLLSIITLISCKNEKETSKNNLDEVVNNEVTTKEKKN